MTRESPTLPPVSRGRHSGSGHIVRNPDNTPVTARLSTTRLPDDPLVFGFASLVVLMFPAVTLARAWSYLPTGQDLDLYLAATRSWLTGGPFYDPAQLAGSYHVVMGNVLYPPVTLWLLVPFTVLPAVLWYAIPLAILAAIIASFRPHPIAWPFMALCVAWPATPVLVLNGNPGIWAAAAFAAGLRWQWPAVLVLLKPSLLPFALWGAWSKRWWYALELVVVFCLPFREMWLDWANAALNSHSDGPSLFYSIGNVPLMLLPLIAWAARMRSTAVLEPSLRAPLPASTR